MILIASAEEKEIIKRLRELGGKPDSAEVLTAEIIALKKQKTELEIEKSKSDEEHAKQERELRHMIGLEKKRQEVELQQAKKETELTVREANLAADKKRFEEQLEFNTERFETMEKYLKDTLREVLDRLPNVNMEINKGTRRK